jgi:hypothetical protein
MTQKSKIQVTITSVENGFLARISNQQYVFPTLKELLDFIAKQYTPEEPT